MHAIPGSFLSPSLKPHAPASIMHSGNPIGAVFSAIRAPSSCLKLQVGCGLLMAAVHLGLHTVVSCVTYAFTAKLLHALGGYRATVWYGRHAHIR